MDSISTDNPLTFKHWCEKNGYLYTGHSSYESFEKRANQYQCYLNSVTKSHNEITRKHKVGE